MPAENYTVEDLDNYFHRLHINTAWTLLTNFTAIYLVLTRTTKEMGNYKYYLLLTLFSPMIMDLHISVIFGIFMTMPVGGQCAAGFVRHFGQFFGSIFQFGMMHETVSWAGVSLLYGFLYRYFSIKGTIHRFHNKRNIVFLALFLLIYPMPAMIALYYGDRGHSYEEQLKFILDNVPQYYFIYKEFKICNVLTENYKAAIYLSVAIIQILIVYTGYIVISVKIVRLLRKVKSSLTTATYVLQKQLFKALIFQCAIPLIFLAGPMWLLMAIVLFQLPYSGVYSQYAIQCLSLHASANAIMVIVMIKPYREGLYRITTRPFTNLWTKIKPKNCNDVVLVQKNKNISSVVNITVV